MSAGEPILVTGAAGRVGGVGGAVVEALRRRGLSVRALLRSDDERTAAMLICRDFRAGVVAASLAAPARPLTPEDNGVCAAAAVSAVAPPIYGNLIHQDFGCSARSRRSR